jgi:PrtD family type I secretion system ABC transporter
MTLAVKQPILSLALRACYPHLATAAVFSALINLLYLAPTLYMLQVYDRVLSSGGQTTLAMVSIALLLALVTLTALDWARNRLLVRCGARIDRVLAGPVLEQILTQRDLGRVDRLQLTRDFDHFRQIVSGSGALAAFDVPWTPIYIIAAFLLHPVLGALALCASALLIFMTLLNEHFCSPALTRANTTAAGVYARQNLVSEWAEEVRALGMVNALVTRQLVERSQVISLQTTASLSSGHLTAIVRLLRLVLQSAALGVAAWLAIKGEISGGSLMAASLLLTRALAPVEQLLGASKGILRARDAYRNLRNLFEKSASQSTPTTLPTPLGNLDLERVTVETPIGAKALSNITLEIKAGEMIGVTGPSGSGKSTLIRALAGGLELSGGVIRIDGASRLDWSQEHLARHIGYVPQNLMLFAGTVKENIARFRTEASKELDTIDQMAIDAARAAGAHDMILRLPQGYDTPVGIGGVGLSGGQTQRICIARALFGWPCIVLMDEPNSSLDAHGEAALCDTLAALRENGTTLVVAAHRQSVLAGAQKILTLNAGEVHFFGSLQELTERMKAAQPQPQPQNVRTPFAFKPWKVA